MNRNVFGVVMSVADYNKTIAPEDKALTAIRDNANRAGLDKLTMEEVDAEIAAHRREKRDQKQRNKTGR